MVRGHPTTADRAGLPVLPSLPFGRGMAAEPGWHGRFAARSRGLTARSRVPAGLPAMLGEHGSGSGGHREPLRRPRAQVPRAQLCPPGMGM